MKWLLALLIGVLGALGGAASLYCLTTPLYSFYAWLNPVDASAECARGGGIAWLALLIGAGLGSWLGSRAVLQLADEVGK